MHFWDNLQPYLLDVNEDTSKYQDTFFNFFYPQGSLVPIPWGRVPKHPTKRIHTKNTWPVMHFWVFLLASRGTRLVLYPDPHPEVEYQKDVTKGFTSCAQTPPSSHEAVVDLGFNEGGFIRLGALVCPQKFLQTTPTSSQKPCLYVVEQYPRC